MDYSKPGFGIVNGLLLLALLVFLAAVGALFLAMLGTMMG